MELDRLNSPLDQDAWAESSVACAFASAWDAELFGLTMPPWRAGVVKLVQCAAQHLGKECVTVADMGCGAAVYARHFLKAGIRFDYHGYDHNEAVLRAACERWRFLPNDHVQLHMMDARAGSWPIADDKFDVVIWDTTLRFCEDVRRCLAESARVCRGWIILARTPLEKRAWREAVHYYDMAAPSCDWHFDLSMIRGPAREHRLHLNTHVTRDDTHVLSREPLPAELSTKAEPGIERVLHEAFVKERVRRVFDRHDGPWCVFGAGEHSRWLFTILPSDLRRRVTCFADDAAPTGFAIDGIDVRRPSDVAIEESAGVLVSSDTMEDRLFERARAWFGRTERVYRIYEHLPARPYDKRPAVHPAPADSRPRHVASTQTPRSSRRSDWSSTTKLRDSSASDAMGMFSA